ncbi:ABC transporter ATP-binding protein [Leucobacter sp. M11]|uniref:ABC transporter ATP-binding protein n=1 Tax=Leucobacter sp. M11 TaxID=2993565 RepID=UPI002D804DBB|nr:ATP-binding cassette domain-containing protein [Leucobacter sp. M11]MEB4613364.1 ATP-binding cassette domain-containing protein [Leucobacter sp. M11]
MTKTVTAQAGGRATPAISAQEIDLHYGPARVLREVSFDIDPGQVVGLVGESGSGKSTLAKAIVGVERISAGTLTVLGEPAGAARGQSGYALRRRVQLIPQDPFSSLNPRRTIGQTIAEAIDPRRSSLAGHRDEIVALLERMQLSADSIDRLPHQFSGGQRQRIAIARALAVGPELIIADEITSALDVSVQAEILALLDELLADSGITMLFISHNLAVVSQLCTDVMIMRSGELVEHGAVAEVFVRPAHPYTRRLLDSIPGSPGFSLERA